MSAIKTVGVYIGNCRLIKRVIFEHGVDHFIYLNYYSTESRYTLCQLSSTINSCEFDFETSAYNILIDEQYLEYDADFKSSDVIDQLCVSNIASLDTVDHENILKFAKQRDEDITYKSVEYKTPIRGTVIYDPFLPKPVVY